MLREEENPSADRANTGCEKDGSHAHHDARHRISNASEEDAAQFIWMELPRDLKEDWDARLVRSVLDTCHRFEHQQNRFLPRVGNLTGFRYSPETAGNRFVRLYDDVMIQSCKNFQTILTLQQQILSGVLTAALWQQQSDEIIASLLLEEESFSADRELAQQLQAE